MKKSWYREPGTWVLALLPLGLSGGGLLFILIVFSSSESPRRGDPGRALQTEAALQVSAEISLAGTEVALQLFGTAEQALQLNFYYPDTRQLDQSLLLRAAGDAGRFFGELQKPLAGPRYLELTDRDGNWQLRGLAWFPTQELLHMKQPDAAR